MLTGDSEQAERAEPARVGVVGATVRKLMVVRPQLFGSSQKCFFRSFSRGRFGRGIAPIAFMRSGRSRSYCKIVQKLRFRGPPCARDGLIHIVGNYMLSMTMSVHGGSPAFKRRMTMRLANRGRLRFFVPGKFTRKFTMLDRRTIFRCGYSRFCRPRDRKTMT